MNDYRALVCITTCGRLEALERYLPHFAAFSASDPRFHLLVALDGDEAAYREFCDAWDVPLVWADEREGVGLSRNRVLKRFPDFDYYFFLDDDVELLDCVVFPAHVELARDSGIHHFSLSWGGARAVTGESTIEGVRVVHGMYGGGQFGFYSGEGLRTVGGWHTDFARYRRWGHTEHSHRFRSAGLAPAPFNVAVDLRGALLWHYPPPVTNVEDVEVDEHGIALPERRIMDQRLVHFPVRTLSPHHFNGKEFAGVARLARTLEEGERYPLVEAKQRRHCWSDYHLWSARRAERTRDRVAGTVKAALRWPGNPMLRHVARTALERSFTRRPMTDEAP